MSKKTEFAIESRERVGMPVLTCPNCGLRGVRHWVPATLDASNRHVDGYFTCKSMA